MTGALTDLGPSRVEVDGSVVHPTLRPRDAASLVLIDRTHNPPRVLMGKRAKGHAFMPDLYVFPGGRRDANDGRAPIAAPLDERVVRRLTLRTPARFTERTATALAVAAARELEEEVALSLSPREAGERFLPDLSKLRYFARAVTPPGRNRRFDTRFFACFTDEIESDTAAPRTSAELVDIAWLPIDDSGSLPLPYITRVILSDLADALAENAALPYGMPVPFYYTRNRRSLREII